jgi:hypothetical protein
MKWIARLLACLGVVAGCQRSSGSPPPVSEVSEVSEAYRQDIARLCDVMVESGADQLPAGERALSIARWLSDHLATPEAHDYLIRIQPLVGEPKAAALETEARRVGLAGCALAAEWRTGDPAH